MNDECERKRIRSSCCTAASRVSKRVVSVAAEKTAGSYLKLRFPSESKIFTHLTPREKLKLRRLSLMACGSRYVEIGSYIGASSCFIADGIMKLKESALLYCIDTWTNDAMTEGERDTYGEFLKNTSVYEKVIVPLRGLSQDIARGFDRAIDFIFIDADHSYEGVKMDVESWVPYLKKGGIVVFHDISWAEGVQRVVREEISPLAVKEGRLPNLYWAWL